MAATTSAGLTVTIRHGPDGDAVWEGAAGDLPGALPRGAYHGIVPLALAPLADDDWPALAPALDRALVVLRDAGEPPEDLAAMPRLHDLARAALDAGVLAYADSARAAWRIAARRARGALEAVELWSVREGRTSSVWRVELHTPGGAAQVLAVDVARDGAAAAHVSAAAELRAGMHARDERGVLAVLEHGPVAAAGATVHAVVSPWLEHARELHLAPREGGARFVAVERFVMGDDGRQRILGRVLDSETSDALWEAWLRARVRHARFAEGRVSAPAIDVLDGDLVLDGDRAVVVDVTPPEAPAPLASWVPELVAASAGPGLAWGDWARARRVVTAALAEHPEAPAHAAGLGRG